MKTLKQNVVKAIVLTGYPKEDTALSPRIPIIPSDLPYLPSNAFSFHIKRLAMTSNKAQIQTQVAVMHLQKSKFVSREAVHGLV